VAERLEPWYAESPERRAALDQIDRAAPRPDSGGYALWQQYLAEAIERVTKGRADPLEALEEAQRRAQESR
jgi:sn-glycerol 3-phosphate transport system substrate-binding protein